MMFNRFFSKPHQSAGDDHLPVSPREGLLVGQPARPHSAAPEVQHIRSRRIPISLGNRLDRRPSREEGHNVRCRTNSFRRDRAGSRTIGIRSWPSRGFLPQIRQNVGRCSKHSIASRGRLHTRRRSSADGTGAGGPGLFRSQAERLTSAEGAPQAAEFDLVGPPRGPDRVPASLQGLSDELVEYLHEQRAQKLSQIERLKPETCNFSKRPTALQGKSRLSIWQN